MILYITNKNYKLAKKHNTLEITDKENNIK